MPTFTAIALDTLLEPGASKSVDKSIPRSVPKPSHGPNLKLERRNSASVAEKKPKRPLLTPSLYATPEATPLPDSPTSFTPSPYIINHKRRGPRLLKSSSDSNVALREKSRDEGKNAVTVDAESSETMVTCSVENDYVAFEIGEAVEEKPQVSGCHDCEGSGNENPGDNEDGIGKANSELGSSCRRIQDSLKQVPSTPERDSEREDFYDPLESMSYTSNTDVEDNAVGERSALHGSSMGEFFDAWDDLSSEGGQQLFSLRDTDVELREMQLSLLTEIEKRKQAEEALNTMQKRWQNIRQQLSHVGLTLPADPTIVEESGEEICQQVYLARFVANSIGRGFVRAELEAEMETQIEAKNFEITRLCDKLRNYEAMNQEMVQRNRDVLDTVRREREKKEKRQRWIWGSLAAALTLGAAGLAWSYLPSGSGSTSSSSPSSYGSEVPQADDGVN